MNVSSIVRSKGFIGKARFLREQSSSELEDRLGYGRSRLADGWYLLFLLEMPTPSDFEFRGYTHFSRGVEEGHNPQPRDPRTMEERLRDDGYNLPHLKRRLINDVFMLEGPDRLAKVRPVRSGADYPQGSGVPQWELTREKQFLVAAFIKPGDRYRGDYI